MSWQVLYVKIGLATSEVLTDERSMLESGVKALKQYPDRAEGLFFDYAATTPVRSEVIEAVTRVLQEGWGNPSSTHGIGRRAKEFISIAREQAASLIHASVDEIFFTSGGTEADNLAVISGAFANAVNGKHVITSSAEHHAVLDACGYLETRGFAVTYLQPDEFGRSTVNDVLAAVRPDTCLLSLIHGNNELGTVNPIADICAALKGTGIWVHTDAVQTTGKIPVDVHELGVDLLSLSAHKLYAPKGVGALYCRQGVSLGQRQWGGNQESRLRPGTENAPGIVGLGKACELIAQEMADESVRLHALRERLLDNLTRATVKWKCNTHPVHHLPHIFSVSFAGVNGIALLSALEQKGVYLSAGSACDAAHVIKSHVLDAIGLPDEYAGATIRISLGKWTTASQVDELAYQLLTKIEAARL